MLEGVFTHLSSSEIHQSDYTDYQLGIFREGLVFLGELGVRYRYAHSANSASIQRFPDSHMDIVRPGIMLYGSGSMGEVDLRPVMKLKTRIVQLRKAPPGTPVGYRGSFVTGRETLVATLPIGYADGYPRALSNRAKVFPGRKTCSAYRICLHGFYHGRCNGHSGCRCRGRSNTLRRRACKR